jgi:hypothetical protein
VQCGPVDQAEEGVLPNLQDTHTETRIKRMNALF